MNINKENFEKWYKLPLEKLYRNPDAGFIIMMTALPLLERYLREKSQTYEMLTLKDPEYYDALRIIFPEIQSNDVAKKFWNIYRHGLLHQVSLKTADRRNILPEGWLSNKGEAVNFDTNQKFIINPQQFADKVIKTIEENFNTFEGHGSPNHTFPTIDIETEDTRSLASQE